MTEIKTIYPMLASGGQLEGSLWDNPEWWAEEKIDGSRYLMHIGKEGNRFTSRQKSRKTGLPVEKTENVPHLAKMDLGFLAGTILDGEMQHNDFSKTVSVMGSLPERAIALQEEIGWINYHVFDILEYKGEDVRELPHYARRKLLEEVMLQIRENDFNCFIDTTAIAKENKREFYENIVQKGGEGVILKNIHGKYRDGERSKDWVKIKRYLTDDVVIIGSTLPSKIYDGKDRENWEYWEDGKPVTKAWYNRWLGAIRFGKFKNGKLVELGQTSGIDDQMKELLSDGNHGIKEEYIGTVIEIGAMEQLKSGAYRHPRFVRLRPDKDAEGCVL